MIARALAQFHSMRNRRVVTSIALHIVLLFGALISLFPFYWMFIGATKVTSEIFRVPPSFLPSEHLVANVTRLVERLTFTRVVWNSLAIAVVYSVLTVFLCSLAGYAFAKYRFKGRNVMFALILLTLMVPYQATLIPLFRLMTTVLGWGSTYRAVILPTTANVFGIFLMRQNMLSVPDSLIESGRIDGAGEFDIFARIVLPTMTPALSALTIYMFMFQWNNFMWPLIILSRDSMKTIPVALSGMVADGQVIEYGVVLAGTSIATIPIIVMFLFLQRQFISGILGGAVKG
ncbi:MAG: carbohydrate ABC transporter permease [Spirochaetales bacterium]